MLKLGKRFFLSATLIFSFACFAENDFPDLLKRRTVPRQETKHQAGGSTYQFLFLSDTHYDHAQYYPKRKTYASPHAVMWQGKMQSMVHAAASKIDGNTKFVLHAGDLMDGNNVKQPDLFLKMLKDITGYLKSEFASVPLCIVAGNHDECHPNKAIYDAFMKKYLSTEMKREIKNTTFYFLEGADLFLCIGFKEPDLDVIREALKQHADARYKFVLTHAPVIPSESWESSLFERDSAKRKEIRELFLKNDVIVLSGHIHSLENIRCETDSGRITQLITSCVWLPQLGLEPQMKISGAEKYMQLNPKLSPFGRALLTEYKDAVTEYVVFADRKSNPRQPKIQHSGAGYYVIHAAPEGVTADFYPGNTTDAPAWSIRLR